VSFVITGVNEGGPVPPATVVVATNHASYTTGDTVTVTARVTSGTSPVASTTVGFTITKPTGAMVSQTATTASDGTATYQLRLRRSDPVGTYQVTAALADQSDVATTQFTVK